MLHRITFRYLFKRGDDESTNLITTMGRDYTTCFVRAVGEIQAERLDPDDELLRVEFWERHDL